jgi:hypothetical protein
MGDAGTRVNPRDWSAAKTKGSADGRSLDCSRSRENRVADARPNYIFFFFLLTRFDIFGLV